MSPNLERLGRAPHTVNLDTVDLRQEPLKRSELRKRRLPSGKMSRSLYLITTERRLVFKMQPIEVKKQKPHEYRNSNNTPEGRNTCDWDGKGNRDPIHIF